jgi:hypothetical protein
MKSFITIVLLSVIAATGYSKDTTAEDIRVAQSIRKSATNIRATSSVVRHVTSDEVCEVEVLQLESNEELTSSLDTLISDLDTAFSENIHDFCSISFNPSGILMECVMDYEQYSSDYENLCTQSNGVVHKIRFISICEAEHFDMEIELSNLPSCFGQSCDESKVNEVITLLLGMAESMLNEEDSGMKCSIIHDYDNNQSIADTANVVGASTSEEDSGGFNINKNSILRIASALVAASAFFF